MVVPVMTTVWRSEGASPALREGLLMPGPEEEGEVSWGDPEVLLEGLELGGFGEEGGLTSCCCRCLHLLHFRLRLRR